MPEISVILDNYNYAEYLPEAITSVLAQSYSDFELIIVDDGSTDNSAEIICEYAKCDKRITPVFKTNGGQTSAFNAGFVKSTGNIIAFLDSDDYWYPDKLKQIYSAHKKHSIIQHLLAKNGGEPYRKVRTDVDFSIALTEYGYMYQHSPTSALSFSRDVIAPFFPLSNEQEMCGYTDGCILMLAMTLAKVKCMDDILGFYRVHGKNLSAEIIDSCKALWDVSQKQRDYVNKQLHRLRLKAIPKDNGQYLEHLISRIRIGSMPVAVYGSGNTGKRVVDILNKQCISIWGIASSFCSEETVSPHELFDRREEFGSVIIASYAQDEIKRLLLNLGFEKTRIIEMEL